MTKCLITRGKGTAAICTWTVVLPDNFTCLYLILTVFYSFCNYLFKFKKMDLFRKLAHHYTPLCQEQGVYPYLCPPLSAPSPRKSILGISTIKSSTGLLPSTLGTPRLLIFDTINLSTFLRQLSFCAFARYELLKQLCVLKRQRRFARQRIE